MPAEPEEIKTMNQKGTMWGGARTVNKLASIKDIVAIAIADPAREQLVGGICLDDQESPLRKQT